MQAIVRGLLLLVSLISLGVLMLIIGFYVIYRQRRPARVEEEIVKTPSEVQQRIEPEGRSEEEEKQVGKIKTVTRPVIPIERLIPLKDIQAVPRIIDADVVRTPRAATITVLEFDAPPIRRDIRVTPGAAFVSKVVAIVMASPGISRAALPGNVTLSAPLPAVPGVKKSAAMLVRVARASTKPGGLSMVKNIAAADISLVDIAQSVTLGGLAIEPLPTFQ